MAQQVYECGILGCETKHPIECAHCQYISCIKCTQTFILSQTKAECMNCHKEYDEPYLRTKFSKSWMAKDYAKWKKEKLIEREKGFLPETVDYLDREKNKLVVAKYILTLKANELQLKDDIVQAKHTIKLKKIEAKHAKKDETKLKTIQRAIEQANTQIELCRTELEVIATQIRILNGSIATVISYINPRDNEWRYNTKTLEELLNHGRTLVTGEQTNTQSSGSNVNTEHRSFVKPCPAEDCRGFLSTKWNCGLCNTKVCKDCHEIITEEDSSENEEKKQSNHVCDPNNIETARALQRETKGCPKCGVRIYKIDGCFAGNTVIPLYNGGFKMSQDIQVGDVLIGDDGLKRNVLNLCSGEDAMYRIKQNNGVEFIVNSKHKLVLVGLNHEEHIMTVDDYIMTMTNNPVLLYCFKSTKDKTSFTVEPVGRGKYYGWSIDGNQKFVLEDYTVVHNCSQMFCVSCHTAFDWRTGNIETGTIHNPHYFQYLRENNLTIQRFDHPDARPAELGCGEIPTFQHVQGHFNRRSNGFHFNHPYTIHAFLGSVSELVRLKTHIFVYNRRGALADIHHTPEQNRDLRIRYLYKEIDEKSWNQTVMRRYKKVEYNRVIHNLNDTLMTVFDDLLVNLLTLKDTTITPETLQPFITFLQYYNRETTKACEQFSYNINQYYIPISFRSSGELSRLVWTDKSIQFILSVPTINIPVQKKPEAEPKQKEAENYQNYVFSSDTEEEEYDDDD